MRRAQSVRNHNRSTLAIGVDDLGALKESPDETNEDFLRRQLLEKDRENDKLQSQIQSLQVQLAQRPPLEAVQELQREFKNLDLLLQGTQRENERCMSELERSKKREKMLERELEKLAGVNWQNALGLPSSSVMGRGPAESPKRSETSLPSGDSQASVEATMAHIEQVRLMILGMEQRLDTRETELAANIQKAQAQSTKFEEMRRQVLATTS